MLGYVRAALLALACSQSVLAVNSVVVEGQEFVDSVTKNRFYIIGVDYQPGGQAAFNPEVNADVLSTPDTCLRDAAILQKLGVNTIRVYNLSPNANHDQCASIFNTAGIYMILDVNTPQISINRANPSSSYTLDYLNHVFGMVEAFKGYPNTLGFFGANEVINDIPSSQANPPYIRAVQRDLRQYIAKHASRPIPVGYSAADVREVLGDTWEYLQCQLNGTSGTDYSRSEFFGLNSYSWCGSTATYQTSQYDQLVSLFNQSSIPIFFSEYGCNKVMPRTFDEVQALYGPLMTSLSGGLVYEYSQETSDFGLTNINDNGTVSLLVDFDNLQSQYNKLNITLLESTLASNTQITPPVCSPGLISNSGFGTNFNIPSIPSGGQALIDNGISNPNQGKLVSVTNLTPTQAVYASNGQQLKGLSVTAVSSANIPNGGNLTSNDANSTSGNSTTKKSAAATVSAWSSWYNYVCAAVAVAGVMITL